MRPIHLARLDETRPVLVLTRDAVRHRLSSVTVAPITSRVRGLSTEIPVGPKNGLDHRSVVNVDNIATIAVADLGRQAAPGTGAGAHRSDPRGVRPRLSDDARGRLSTAAPA